MSNTTLFDAIKSSNVEEVRQILSNHDIDINATLSNGKEAKTALYLAVEEGNIDIIQILLSNSVIDVNKKTILELPIEETNNYYYGENANEPNTYGEHGGYHAPMYPNEQEKFCAEHNNTMETTPLYLAVSKKNKTIVQMLLSQPNIDVNPITIRKYGALKPNERQTMTNTYWNTQKKAPIHLAIEKKNIEIVQLLLSHPQIDVNLPFLYEGGHNFLEKYSIKKSPLCVAIDADCSDIFQLLINHNDVNASYEIVEEEHNEARRTYDSKFYPLHLAAKKGNPLIIKSLLKQPNVDVNALFISNKVKSITTTALNIAIENNNVDAVRILLLNPKTKVDINQVSSEFIHYEINKKEEMTPLYIAVNTRNKEIVRLLLSKSQINVNDPYNYSYEKGYSVYRGLESTSIKKTPLSLAVENEDVEIVELLLARENIDVNIPFEYKSNYTIKKNNSERQSETVKILSPLFVAVQKDNDRIVEDLLIKSQINLQFVSIINGENETSRKTAIELAHEKGNEKIISLFENYN